MGLSDDEAARREIERNDAAHNGTMQRLFGIDWQDASLYAVVLNTDRIPVDDCVETIVRLVNSPAFQETEESGRALADQLIVARVRSALERELGAASARYGFEAEVFDGRVTLRGRPRMRI